MVEEVEAQEFDEEPKSPRASDVENTTTDLRHGPDVEQILDDTDSSGLPSPEESPNFKSMTRMDSFSIAESRLSRSIKNADSNLSSQNYLRRPSLSGYVGRDKYEKDEPVDIERKPSQRRLSNLWEALNIQRQDNPDVKQKSGESLFGDSKRVKETAVIKLFDVEENVHRRSSLHREAEVDTSVNGSGNSKSTISIGLSKFPHAQEVSETISSKMQSSIPIGISVVFNAGLILMAYQMQRQMRVPLSPGIVALTIGVFVEVLALISNQLTIHTLGEVEKMGIVSFIVTYRLWRGSLHRYVNDQQAGLWVRKVRFSEKPNPI
ncbi:hypothetical protein HDU83_009172 [Entophlyctis luteolus]|nr:hypothetical protein HDU83_009172 [Entophlyctis luteolus]